MERKTNPGAWHLADRPELYDPMRTNHFDLIVHDIENLQLPGSTLDERIGTDGTNSNQEVLRLAVNKVNVPNFTQDVKEVKRGNTSVKFAGTMSFGAGSMEIIDYIGADSLSIILAWRRLAGDIVNETIGRAKNYKKHCTLNEYTPDFELVRTWDIYGAWLSEADIPEFTNEGDGEIRKISCKLQFDKMIPTLDNANN